MVKKKSKEHKKHREKKAKHSKHKESLEHKSDKKIADEMLKVRKEDMRKFPSLQLKRETEIAMDFATKVYQKFNKMVKSVILFGSSVKQTAVAGSDIDIVIIIDDVSIDWDQELIAWYREELEKILKSNPYNRELHINTIKLSTWWEDLMKGDPVVINEFLLVKGKIKSTPEAIYNSLKRAPLHFSRSKVAELNAIEGLYWAMVDSAHAALIAANCLPPSPEHIPINLKEAFVDTGKLKMKYVTDYRDLHFLHKKIAHGEVTDLKGVEIDNWQAKTEAFMQVMTQLVKDIVGA